MILDDFRSRLSTHINPSVYPSPSTRLSSVLIVIYDRDPKILMTKKSSHLSIHAGEIAFPGGKVEPDDPHCLHTALRESKEEINLDIPDSHVIGQLEPVRTLNSNYTIIPFVSVLDRLPKLEANPEVEKILHIPAEPLLNTLSKDCDPQHNAISEMYTLTYDDHLIWGASARMLKQIADKLCT